MRNEIPEAISQCLAAGITVRMVTGDSTEVAIAIAKDCGILNFDYDFEIENSYTVMEGRHFRQEVGVMVDPYMSLGENLKIKDKRTFKEMIRELRVLARPTSEDKYLLVNGLRSNYFFVVKILEIYNENLS